MDVEMVVTVVVALITTLTGALGGPYFLESRRAKLEAKAQQRTNRQLPYVNFVASVEDLQILLDSSAKGESVDRDRILDAFRDMERHRAQVDIVGSPLVRVWAYRCRLALAGMDKDLTEKHDHRSHYRSKLHDARKEFVALARSELSLDPTAQVTPEDSVGGHRSWIGSAATDDAAGAISVPYADLTSWLADGAHDEDAPTES